jgi:hypothetical protein
MPIFTVVILVSTLILCNVCCYAELDKPKKVYFQSFKNIFHFLLNLKHINYMPGIRHREAGLDLQGQNRYLIKAKIKFIFSFLNFKN